MVNSQPMPAHALSLGQFPTVISRNLNLSIIATGIMAFVGILTETMTNVLLPVLMGLFTVSTATVQWLTTGSVSYTHLDVYKRQRWICAGYGRAGVR